MADPGLHYLHAGDGIKWRGLVQKPFVSFELPVPSLPIAHEQG